MRASRVHAVLVGALLSASAAAHEFWVMPSDFSPEPGTAVRVTLEHGERFLGDPVPRDEGTIRSFVIEHGGVKTDVIGRDGSATSLARPSADGLHTIVYHTIPMPHELHANDFDAYVREEGLPHIADERARRGESGEAGVETYTRCAKSLIAVGEVSGERDAPVGLPLEIVLETPMGELDQVEQIGARVTFDREPLPGLRVVVVRQDDPTNLIELRTDDDGRIAWDAGERGVWMVTTIHMVRAPEDAEEDWRSYWASLTFESP